MATIFYASGFQLGLYAQEAAKLNSKVTAVHPSLRPWPGTQVLAHASAITQFLQ